MGLGKLPDQFSRVGGEGDVAGRERGGDWVSPKRVDPNRAELEGRAAQQGGVVADTVRPSRDGLHRNNGHLSQGGAEGLDGGGGIS